MNKETLQSYNNMLGENNTDLASVLEIINSLPDSIKEVPSKYAPKHISFYQYDGTDLTDEINNITLSNMTKLFCTFRYCTNVTKLDLSSWDVSNITSIQCMCSDCTKVTEINLNGWDTKNITQCYQAFKNCSSLQKLDMRTCDWSHSPNGQQAFDSVPTNCLIIVKDDRAKSWVTSYRSGLTNVKTVAELEG